jgi:proprotein convertase subtilisin/kexin type 2
VAVRSVGDLGSSTSLSPEGTLLPVNGTGTADTLFAQQWHLDNTGQVGADAVAAAVGEDLNLPADCHPAATCRGEGVRVAVVDDGLEIAHADLKANVFPGLSYNYLDDSNDPTEPASVPEDGHGTAVAGIIAARDLNDIGVRGVAPRANLVGYNMLQTGTNADVADAMARNIASIDVSNNSWGPASSWAGCPITAPTSFTDAITTGITTGRGGLGTIYVFAGGNDDSGTSSCSACRGNANLSRYTTMRGVITVGALNAQGTKATYSNLGANLVVSAPGGEYCTYTSSGGTVTTGSLAVTTTDRTGSSKGLNRTGSGYTDLGNAAYTKCMNGTSSAAPNASGAVARIIQANPTLTYRDVRQILAQTARQVDPTDPEWITNGAATPRKFNPRYGHGAIDVDAALTLATGWTNMGAEITRECATVTVSTAIPENNVGVISDCAIAAGITNTEYVEVTFTATHTAVTDLEVSLTNLTTGTTTKLTRGHANSATGEACVGASLIYSGTVLGAEAFLDENPTGNWRLTVKDPQTNTKTGTFTSWSMKVYGR